MVDPDRPQMTKQGCW